MTDNPDPNKENYVPQGHWNPQGAIVIYMWRHRAHGYIVFQDHEKSRTAKVLIAPWTVRHA